MKSMAVAVLAVLSVYSAAPAIGPMRASVSETVERWQSQLQISTAGQIGLVTASTGNTIGEFTNNVIFSFKHAGPKGQGSAAPSFRNNFRHGIHGNFGNWNFAPTTEIPTWMLPGEIDKAVTFNHRDTSDYYQLGTHDQIKPLTGIRSQLNIPEPATIILISLGILALGALGFRRR